MMVAGLLHHLDDLAGEGADVGAPVPAHLGLVAHAAERKADELAARGAGDGLGERRLADAGRPHEAQDRPLGLHDQLADRQEFQDALLDLLEAVVVLVEDLLGALDVPDLPRRLLPRHRQQPVDVVAGDRGLRRHRRHPFEALQLGEGLLLDLLRHAGGLDLLGEFLELLLGVGAARAPR